MSATAIADAAPAEAGAKKKGGKLKKLILFVALPLLLIGGGVGAGLYVGKGHDEKHEDENRPKLVPREGVKVAAGAEPEHPDPKLYKATYYPIDTTFTSNLANSDSFVQIGIGVSTYYDQKVTDALKNDEMPIRSAVLTVLADQDADTIGTTEGRLKLQRGLKDAINKVLVAREGFGGIDDVYFTSMVIQ